MLNTYLSYQNITRDIAKSIGNVARQPVVDRETAYYRENIGKVKSVEDFVKDDRLYRYAMKAHGLEDMTYAKAFMVKVLKEGVTDPDSFANKLTDKRYAEFARTFDFVRNGELATAFNRSQHDVPRNFALQALSTTSQPGFSYVEEETANFLDRIWSVTSIDELMADTRLLNYALRAHGLDPDAEPVARVREMLEGGVSDPASPANQLTDKRYAKLVATFNFVEFGAQTTSRMAVQMDTPRAFVKEAGLAPANGAPTAALAEAEYFKANIGNVTSIAQFMSDSRLLTFAMTAFGLDAKTESRELIRNLLAGGASDPSSPANQLTDKRYAAFVRAFDFVEHGAATTSRDEVTEVTPALYFEGSDPSNAYFRANITSVTSVSEFLLDERLLTYAMAAYGLDARTEPRDRVRDMLLGGLSDPNSPANLSNDPRYKAFVAAFDFAAHGAGTTSRAEVVERTPRIHVENANPETAYFRANIGKVTSIEGLLADKRLLTYAMAAFGLDAGVEDVTTVRRMLQGGAANPFSPANLMEDKSYARFVAAFDFTAHGTGTTALVAAMDFTTARYTKMSSLGLVGPSAEYVKAETDYYNANVTKLRSIDDLMADKRLLNYALTAYGFDPSAESPELIRQMLEGGITDPDSPANKAESANYLAFVSAFNFAQYGEATTTRTPALEPSVSRYLRQTLEEEAGRENEGVRLALYFERNAAKITNVYEILADPALARVVRTALALPESLAGADIDRQAALIEKRLKIEDLQDPEKVGEFLKRFTSLWEIENPSSPALPSVSVLFGQPLEFGISTDVLLTIQKFRS